MHQAKILQTAGKKQSEIAEILGVSTRMVRYYLSPKYNDAERTRGSLLDPYREYITEQIGESPHMNLILLKERLEKLGYQGGMTILREYAKCIRDDLVKKAVIRFETMPAQQAQVDWKEAGTWIIDGIPRKVYAFVMLLGYSRRAFVRFTLDMKSPTLLACHLEAFKYFGGITAEILYDNMKTAWLYRGGVWEPNPALLEFASCCGFEPKRCKVRRPETKGKVERFIGYLGHNFLAAARSKDLRTIEDLNTAVNTWLGKVNDEPIRAFCETRNERFEREFSLLSPFFPESAPDVRASAEIVVSREGTIRFETNEYSVPVRFLGTTMTLKHHPLTREAAIYAKGFEIRRFPLLPKGSHGKVLCESDRRELFTLWQKQNGGQAKERPTLCKLMPTPDVAVRNPAWYETLLAEVMV
jgi:transposase